MSGYYKSKEVYKQFRDQNNQPKIVPVRGMYVSGRHLEPWYIDHNITINSFTSTPATVKSFTEISEEISDSVMKISDITTTPVEVTDYYTKDFDDNEMVMKISGIETTPLVITEYSQISYDDNEKVLLIQDISTSAISVDKLDKKQVDFGKDFCISITKFTSTALSIT